MMFKTPFEGVLDAVIFEVVEGANERTTTEEHRIFPVPQHKLLETGIDYQTADRSTRAKYTGDKWGGKYLRAPDIYWTILEKGKDKLVRLGDVAEVRFGIKTGANEFFYLNAEAIRRWEIEEEFLKPVIKSPRECKSILIDPSRLKFKLFMCGKDKDDLEGTAALEYIEWGESQEFDLRPSCRGRARWWDLGNRIKPLGIIPCGYREVFIVYQNDGVFADKRLYELDCVEGEFILACLNSSLYPLFLEMQTRSYGGGGGPIDATVYEIANLYVPQALFFDDSAQEKLVGVFRNMKVRTISTIHHEVTELDRKSLDSIIFDALNLTQGERNGVYEAVVNLVEARLSKARSLQGQ